MYDLLVKNGQIVSKDGIYEADILVKDGIFVGFIKDSSEIDAKEVIDANGNFIFPGIIDCHAHINEPGFEYRENYETATRAAVAGGTTTVFDMPLNNIPPTINKEAFDHKLSKARDKSYMDFGLWGGLVGDYDDSSDSIKSNVGELEDLVEEGVVSFKGFTCPNGPLFPTVNLGNVRKSLEILAPHNYLSGFHCEEYGQVLEREKEYKARKEQRSREEKIDDFLAAHDVWTEYVATKNIIDMSRATGARVHICHVSHPMVAQVVKDAQHEGVKVTAETCPHYLLLDDSALYDKGVVAKCTPPLRSKQDSAKLWDYVLDGTLSCIGSDHSPAADEEKNNEEKDIWSAWGGLNAISFLLPSMFDYIYHKKKESPSLISKIMDYNPAKIFGIYGKKGDFKVGFDADIVIVDPDKEWEIKNEDLLTKGKVTVFDGVKGKGMPTHTIIRGKLVAKDGMYKEDAKGYGEFVKANHKEIR
ncbi:MAG: allantoinase AllB [Tissierellia bacterium]|nr:allantoinase AllB [Tissierellia bacterium]